MNRRQFFTTGVAGWFAAPLARADRPPLDARFTYDVSAFAHTDPALLLFRETGQFPTGFHEPKCLAVGPGDSILVGGDKAVKIFDQQGRLQSTLALPALPHAVAGAGDGRVLVALKDHLEVYAAAGQLLLQTEPLGGRAYLTAVAEAGQVFFVADAGHREVLRVGPTGNILSRLKGFAVPSPYFDLHVGADGLLWVVNPGQHRVEAYTLEGGLEFSWGETGLAVAGFCGCCNPVYFTRLPDGRFVTSEKGLNRIKIYDGRGKFLGVVAGPEQLVKDLELAKRACANCQIGFGFPVACDSAGRVLALDPATREVRIFTAKEKKA